jgi:hypothetical protein
MNLFGAARSRKRRNREMPSERMANDGESLAEMARLIYAEMNTEPRQMHVAIQLAREQLQALRELLVSKGLRRPPSS